MKVNIEQAQKAYEQRMKRQRKNKKNWSGGFGYTVKKRGDFTIEKGNYIRGATQ